MTSNSNDTAEAPIRLGRMDRVMNYLESYGDWFRRGEPRYLLTTIGLGALGLVAIIAVSSFMAWAVSSAFAPDPPPAAEKPEPMVVAAGQVVEYAINAVRHFAALHPVGAADPGLLAGLWGLAGLVLVVFSGFTRLGVPLFAAWAAATVWTVYTATGTNPAAAALAAGGMAAFWCLIRFTAKGLASLLT